jgi:ABC-2 type transport system ATP-binding protein
VSEASVIVEDLQRTFGDVEAVNGVTLRVEPGEIYGFLGPNGAGKTTLIRMLTTLLIPTAGRATVAGYDIVREADDVRLRIGVALQEAALDPKQTGTEFLRLQGRLYGLNRSEIDQRVSEVGRLIDIDDAIDRSIGTYSGGMKRRLDLAAALVHNPQVVFLDEPTTGLDPVSRAKVWREVRRLNTELGMTIFLTTQYLEEADTLAHRVGIIDHGKLVAEGTPAELKRGIGADVIEARVSDTTTAAAVVDRIPGIGHVEVGGDEVLIGAADGAAIVGKVAVALNESGVDVFGITLRTPTLDDVFFEVTGGHLQEEEAVVGESE